MAETQPSIIPYVIGVRIWEIYLMEHISERLVYEETETYFCII